MGNIFEDYDIRRSQWEQSFKQLMDEKDQIINALQEELKKLKTQKGQEKKENE